MWDKGRKMGMQTGRFLPVMLLALAGGVIAGMAMAETVPALEVETKKKVVVVSPADEAMHEEENAGDSFATSKADYEKGMAAQSQRYHSRALELLTRSADAGYVVAILELGRMYVAGDGVIQNKETAFSWYKKAADKGDPVGEYKIGMMYLRGRGVRRSYDEAAAWLKKAADQGYPRAQTNYGSLHLAGLGVDQDFVEAVAWFRKAAERNYGEAQYLMGVAYEFGEGVAQDKDVAKEWYRKAVKNGSGNASGSLYRLEGYKR